MAENEYREGCPCHASARHVHETEGDPKAGYGQFALRHLRHCSPPKKFRQVLNPPLRNSIFGPSGGKRSYSIPPPSLSGQKRRSAHGQRSGARQGGGDRVHHPHAYFFRRGLPFGVGRAASATASSSATASTFAAACRCRSTQATTSAHVARSRVTAKHRFSSVARSPSGNVRKAAYPAMPPTLSATPA